MLESARVRIEIRKDDLSDGRIVALLREHRQEMFKYSPPESVHALDLASMHAVELTFWSAWCGNEFAGCGALKELDSSHGEIKSMKTHQKHLRKGVAATLLETILQVAKQRDYQCVSLETGTMQAFDAARTLYANHGFIKCPPFASYVQDPHSVCMTLDL